MQAELLTISLKVLTMEKSGDILKKAFLVGLGLVGLGVGLFYNNIKSDYGIGKSTSRIEHYSETATTEPKLSKTDALNLTNQMQGILERPMEFWDSKLERLKTLRQAYGEEAFFGAMHGIEWADFDGKSAYDSLLEGNKKCGIDMICALHGYLSAGNYNDPRFLLKNTRAFFLANDGTFPGDMPFWYWENAQSISLHSENCGTQSLGASLDNACRERFQHYILMSLMDGVKPFQGDYYSTAERMRRLGGGVFVDAAMRSSTLDEYIQNLPDGARQYATEELKKRLTLYVTNSLNSIGRKDDDKAKHVRHLRDALGKKLSAEILGPMSEYEIVRKALEEQQQSSVRQLSREDCWLPYVWCTNPDNGSGGYCAASRHECTTPNTKAEVGNKSQFKIDANVKKIDLTQRNGKYVLDCNVIFRLANDNAFNNGARMKEFRTEINGERHDFSCSPVASEPKRAFECLLNISFDKDPGINELSYVFEFSTPYTDQ